MSSASVDLPTSDGSLSTSTASVAEKSFAPANLSAALVDSEARRTSLSLGALLLVKMCLLLL